MESFKNHLMESGATLREALERLDSLGRNGIVFIVSDDNTLRGSITDGDIRRALLKGVDLAHSVDEIYQSNPKTIQKGELDINKIIKYRESNIYIIPIVDQDYRLVNIANLKELRSYLPIDAVIMAGGKGTRLKPLTDQTPKPLLKVGGLPIIEHNINRLRLFGIDDFWITLNYLGNQIEDHLGNGLDKNVTISYVREKEPLGTIGSISLINNLQQDYVLLTNSDILTNLDYEHFFLEFINQDADLSVVTIPYTVKIPYAVMETSNDLILGFKEKPTYTYYSNGGIYLMKRKVLELLPVNTFYNATDLMAALIKSGKKVVSYPLMGYW
ncbi:MAG: dTDP-glucose pyrophosphorylase, partial [Parvicella sp.]